MGTPENGGVSQSSQLRQRGQS